MQEGREMAVISHLGRWLMDGYNNSTSSDGTLAKHLHGGEEDEEDEEDEDVITTVDEQWFD